MLQRDPAVPGDRDIDAVALHQLGEHQLIGGVVLGQQDRQPWIEMSELAFERVVAGLGGLCGECRDVRYRQRQRKAECRPAIERGLDADLAAHLLDDTLADREAEAGAAIAAVDRGVHLQEIAEQASDPVGRDADAGVGDR